MQFIKMHGAGNDFVLFDLLSSAPLPLDGTDWGALARRICDRHFGVGADGVLLLLPSDCADARMRIFNLDGSEAQSCGNGIRCLGRYYRDRYGAHVEDLRIQTLGGVSAIRVEASGAVTVDMGPPRFGPADVPVAVEGPDALSVSLEAAGRRMEVGCVSMGNPHAVHFVERGAFDGFPLESIGPAVERHSLFPERVNFEVCEVVDGGRLRVRVWERGAGPTLACGTGACASMVVARRRGLVESPVQVELPGGELTIRWDGVGSVFMTGPAEYVFTGSYSAPIL